MKKLRAVLCVPRTHPSLPGHFPGHPLVPGVVLLDLIVAAIQDASPTALRVTQISSVKFVRPVAPDESVEVTIQLEECEAHVQRARFQALRDTQPVAEGTFLLGPVEQGAPT